MKRSPVLDAALAGLLTVAAAEAAGRLLAPRRPPPEPLPVDLLEHFSEAEISRGRRYARPQRALGMLRSALETAALVAVVRRTARSGGLTR